MVETEAAVWDFTFLAWEKPTGKPTNKSPDKTNVVIKILFLNLISHFLKISNLFPLAPCPHPHTGTCKSHYFSRQWLQKLQARAPRRGLSKSPDRIPRSSQRPFCHFF